MHQQIAIISRNAPQADGYLLEVEDGPFWIIDQHQHPEYPWAPRTADEDSKLLSQFMDYLDSNPTQSIELNFFMFDFFVPNFIEYLLLSNLKEIDISVSWLSEEKELELLECLTSLQIESLRFGYCLEKSSQHTFGFYQREPSDAVFQSILRLIDRNWYLRTLYLHMSLNPSRVKQLELSSKSSALECIRYFRKQQPGYESRFYTGHDVWSFELLENRDRQARELFQKRYLSWNLPLPLELIERIWYWTLKRLFIREAADIAHVFARREFVGFHKLGMRFSAKSLQTLALEYRKLYGSNEPCSELMLAHRPTIV
jgi:hypothetical protein